MRSHRWPPTRLPCPWDSPGKNIGVGCHFLLQCMKMKSESEVSRVWLLVTPWTAAHQAPQTMGLSRKEYWSGASLPSPPYWAEAFYFDIVPLVSFHFCFFCFWFEIQIIISKTNTGELVLVFYSSLMVSRLIFKSLIPFSVNFCVRYKIVVQFHSFAIWLSNFTKTIYWRDCSFLLNILGSFAIAINWPCGHGFISRVFILFHRSMCLFLCQCQTIFILCLCNVVRNQGLWCL